ncbi:MAG: tyrosine-type recombinase/integrase [Eubacteriales bacterium]
MIKIIKRLTASALWEIEGNQVSLPYKKKYPEEVLKEEIDNYRNCLLHRSYQKNNAELLTAFRVFGGISFVAVGMTLPNEFKACFRFFAQKFTEEWALGTQCLKSKFVGNEYVFQTMLRDDNQPICYNFRFILDNTVESPVFCDILEEVFAEYWSKFMILLMESEKSVAYVAKRVGDARVSRYFMRIPDKTERYLRALASQYSKKRTIITKRDLTEYIFQNGGYTRFLGGDLEFFSLFETIVQQEFEKQKTEFVVNNESEWSSSKDIWKIYKVVGVTLKYMQLDFRKINSPPMAQEIRHFLRDRFRRNFMPSERHLSYLFDIANIVREINPKIHYFADISVTDVKSLQKKLENQWSQTHIMTAFSMSRVLFDYLISPYNTSKLPKPKENIFSSVRLVNANKYRKNTSYIPDCVLEQLQQHIHELHPWEARLFQIFSATGMRHKEVAFLEEDCLLKGKYGWILSFKAYKVLTARRKVGLRDYHTISIDEKTAEIIKQQIIDTTELRKEENSPYIFLYKSKGRKTTLPNPGNYGAKMNKLIAKQKITETNGELWHYTTRQSRKTLAVTMIENGAFVAEVAYQFGHFHYSTTMNSYVEVKAMKLVELNTEFFKKQFDLLLSDKHLQEFTVEERKQLYVDFRLSKRKVEFGFCMRKFCEGPCESQAKSQHCINCPNLCTGRQYFPYWLALCQHQEKMLHEMKENYRKEGIEDYEIFAEFIVEKRKLLAYEKMIDKINEETEKDVK